MKKTFLTLALLITGFLLAGAAYGEDEVYYCAEIGSNGFDFDKKSESYKRTWFHVRKFKMNLNKASNIIELAPDVGGRKKLTCPPL